MMITFHYGGSTLKNPKKQGGDQNRRTDFEISVTDNTAGLKTSV